MSPIFQPEVFATPDSEKLRQEINLFEAKFNEKCKKYNRKIRQQTEKYHQTLIELRPVYPQQEIINDIAYLAQLVALDEKNNSSPSNQLSNSQEEHLKKFPLSSFTSFAVHNQNRSNQYRVNFYTHSPHNRFTNDTLWEFTSEEIKALRYSLEMSDLKVLDEWSHYGGYAFVITSNNSSHTSPHTSSS